MLAFSRAISGLRVAEQNLYVTSNNLSNVNTEGYHRQRLIQSELQVTSRGKFSVGLGVDASQVKQVKMEFLENNYRNELPALGKAQIEENVYSSMEAIIGSNGASVQDTISNLWDSFNELAKEYTTSVAGGYLRENAVALVAEFNSIEDQLIKMQNELDVDVKNIVDQINDYSEQIANLNDKITRGEAGGVMCCELRDSRTSIINELANLIDIEVEDFADACINIRIGNGHLVIGTEANMLDTAQIIPQSTFCYPVWAETGEAIELSSGSLKGVLDMRGENVVGNLASSTNGSPKEKMDIVVSIDSDLTLATLEDMRDNISTLIATLDRQSANYQFFTNNGDKIDGNSLKMYADYLYGTKMTGIINEYTGSDTNFTEFIESVSDKCEPEQVIKEYMEDKGLTLDFLRKQFDGKNEKICELIDTYKINGGDSVIGFQRYLNGLDNMGTNIAEVQNYINGTRLSVTKLGEYISDEMVNLPDDKFMQVKQLIDANSSEVLESVDRYNSFIKYRDDSNKYMLAFTDEDIDLQTDIEHTATMLNELDMRLIAVTSEEVSLKWMDLAQQTNGNVYDIKEFETEEGAENIGLSLSRDFNSRLNGTSKEDGIPAFRAGLNQVLNGLANEINAVFRQGVNSYEHRHGDVMKDEKDNDIIDEQTGEVMTYNLDLFLKIDDNLPLQMGNIAINPMFSDLNNMPLSLSGETGDFQIGNMLVDLSTTDIFSNGKAYSTADEQYANFILDFAQATNIAKSNVEIQQNVLNAASEKLLAVSGVSMDEELSNMMKYQYSYTAASKLINVVDQMLETLINI